MSTCVGRPWGRAVGRGWGVSGVQLVEHFKIEIWLNIIDFTKAYIGLLGIPGLG